MSGGARGVDEAAMLGALNNDGSVIGVMADGLLKKATSAKWRGGLIEGNNLILVSSFSPDSEWSVGNAMARNKYIYSLADSALVIHAGTTGGTISGVKENLSRKWVALWVKPTEDAGAANNALVKKGGGSLYRGDAKHPLANLLKITKRVKEEQVKRANPQAGKKGDTFNGTKESPEKGGQQLF